MAALMARPIGDAEERFWRYVSVDPSGCWLWTGYIGSDGYGRIKLATGISGGTPQPAHIMSWNIHRGMVPEGLELDHLCRVRHCVNPEHLEPVTSQVNLTRGEGFSGKNARKTHCVNGHEFTKENTYRHNGSRHCKTCRRQRHAALLRNNPDKAKKYRDQYRETHYESFSKRHREYSRDYMRAYRARKKREALDGEVSPA